MTQNDNSKNNKAFDQLHTSRRLWKNKALERNYRIKILQMRIRDLIVSRDRWKGRAKKEEKLDLISFLDEIS